jgi:hypothetical protein
LGHPCLRYLVLCRTAGEKAERIDPTTLSLFREGDVHERDVKALLAEMGFDIYGSQRSFPPNSYQISGHIDAAFAESWEGEAIEVGCEIKSLNPSHWARIHSARDLNDPSLPHWLREWYTQDCIYMFLSDTEHWLFIIKNKITGDWRILPSEIDYEHTQACLDRAERVNRHVDDGSIPQPITDAAVCRRCKFYKRACYPVVEDLPGALIITDEVLIECAELAMQDQDAAGRYRRNYDRLRETLRMLTQGKSRTIALGEVVAKVIYGRDMMRVYLEKL